MNSALKHAGQWSQRVWIGLTVCAACMLLWSVVALWSQLEGSQIRVRKFSQQLHRDAGNLLSQRDEYWQSVQYRNRLKALQNGSAASHDRVQVIQVLDAASKAAGLLKVGYQIAPASQISETAVAIRVAEIDLAIELLHVVQLLEFLGHLGNQHNVLLYVAAIELVRRQPDDPDANLAAALDAKLKLHWIAIESEGGDVET